VDAPPELRLQLVREEVDHVDAVWFTHLHADHVHGADDLRIFRFRSLKDLPVFHPEGTEDEFLRRFPYVFDETIKPPPGSTIPQFRLTAYRRWVPLEIMGHTFIPIPVPHGPTTVFGFRVGPLGYITDGKSLSSRAIEVLGGVRVLVLNALWFGNPHPTHFNIEEAVEAAREVGADTTYLTHLTHEVGHQEMLDALPEEVRPAYDGLSIELMDEPDGPS
jgi:phosphoribosyl 1,2-cyclic phosphate phosphodiesterase